MMKRVFFVIVLVVLLAGPAFAQTGFKKYDIKSGIVTYDLVMKVGKTTITQKVVVYFDDYGLKERRETWMGGKIQEVNFSDGKEMIALTPAKKQAFKRGTAYRGTELRVEWEEFGSKKDRESGKIKKMPAQTVAGKNCEVFQSDDGKGTVTRYAGWSKILMLLDVKTKTVQSTQTAVKVEENVPVPADKFKVPDGYKLE